MTVYTPHDRFFRKVFDRLEAAHNYEEYIPKMGNVVSFEQALNAFL